MVTGTPFHHPYHCALRCPDMQQPDTHEIRTRDSRKKPGNVSAAFTLQNRLLCSNTGICRQKGEGPGS